MNQKQLNDIKKELEDDVLITDDNVVEKSRRVPHMYQKYLSIYIREAMELKKMKSELDEFYGLAFGKLLTGPRKLNKGEIEYFINGDSEYGRRRRAMEFQEQVCLFLENSVQNVKNLSFNLKNYIDLKIYLQGGK
jgi:hypothetical protein